LKGNRSESLKLRALTQAMLMQANKGDPVHRWTHPVENTQDAAIPCRTVEQLMSRDLFTVHPYDVVNLAATIMDWEHLRHVPVEDDQGNLVGLITHRDLLKLLVKGATIADLSCVPVHAVMKTDLITVAPETSTIDAMNLMRAKKVGALPVVHHGSLVGIITVYDLLSVSAKLFENYLKESG
jgi:CBS domain-containing protein